ncbi:MAG: hypothetical protein ACXAC7_17995, partial [Candidatus Hodarchaeales archaeon]
MTEAIRDSTSYINPSILKLKNPKEIYSMFIPLGENSIINLVEIFRSRDDINIIDTDLYYTVTVKYQDYKISFYSRGIILVEKFSNIHNLERLISQIEETSAQIPALIKDLVTKYHLSLVEVYDDFISIPVHKSIIIDNFDMVSQNIEGGSRIDEKEPFLQELAKYPVVKNFIGEARSISHRHYEDVIIGINGAIIRSEDINVLLSYHEYVRSLHLFLAKYNLEIESAWNSLNDCDTLIDEFEEYLEKKEKYDIDDEETFFTEGRRNTLYKTKSYVFQGLKYGDNFIVLTQFIEDSIKFTKEKYAEDKEAERIKENSFHITKILQVLFDRTKHLKILSESFNARGTTLRSRLELYDSEIASEKIASLENGWTRSVTAEHELPELQIELDAVEVVNPEIHCSLYIPLGENGIIHLVDDFRRRDDVKILNTDLYYHVETKCDCHDYIFSFYSRGLITVSKKLDDSNLSTLIDKTESLTTEIPTHLKKLIPKYHLSLVEVLGEIKTLPIHKTIIINKYKDIPKSIETKEFLKAIAENPKVKSFIDIPRSIDSRTYEDVIIGTSGSILRSDDLETFISYHAYNRSLHLFLANYNDLIEHIWNDLNDCNNLVDEFEEYMQLEKRTRDIEKSAFISSEQREKLIETRFHVIHEIKNIDQFLVISIFIEKSIQFSIEKFTELLESGKIRKNAFHIRKVLRTLQDRAEHLKIVSESFISRSNTLVTRLGLYDAEMTFATQQRAEKVANLESSWKRTFTHGLEPVKVQVDSETVFIKNPGIVCSLYIPLGENGIIRLVDNFQSRDDLKIIDTDLYYHIDIEYRKYEISFYSRGLVTIKANFVDKLLLELIENSENIVQEIPNILKNLLTEYNLSLINILGDIKFIPVHKTILIGHFSQRDDPTFRLDKDKN